jgi:hypothetical protein
MTNANPTRRLIPSPPSLRLCAFDRDHAVAAEVSWKSPGHAFVARRSVIEDALAEAGLPVSLVPRRGPTSIFAAFMRSRRATRVLTLDPDTRLRRSLKVERNFKRTTNGIETLVFTLHTVEGIDAGEESLAEVGALSWAYDKATGNWTLDFDESGEWSSLPAMTHQWAAEVLDAARDYVSEREGEVDNELVQQMLSGFFARTRDAVSHAAACWVVPHRPDGSGRATDAERAVALARVVDENTPFTVFAKSMFPHPADIRQAAWAAADALASDIASVTAECATYAAKSTMKGEKRLAEKTSKLAALRERVIAAESEFVAKLAVMRADLEAASNDLDNARAVEVAQLESFFEGVLEALSDDIDAADDVLHERTPTEAPADDNTLADEAALEALEALATVPNPPAGKGDDAPDPPSESKPAPGDFDFF